MTVNSQIRAETPRGSMAIYAVEGSGIQSAPLFEVYDWSEHYDSGAIVHSCQSRQDAVSFAIAYAAAHNRRMPNAELLEFPGSAS